MKCALPRIADANCSFVEREWRTFPFKCFICHYAFLLAICCRVSTADRRGWLSWKTNMRARSGFKESVASAKCSVFDPPQMLHMDLPNNMHHHHHHHHHHPWKHSVSGFSSVWSRAVAYAILPWQKHNPVITFHLLIAVAYLYLSQTSHVQSGSRKCRVSNWTYSR